jgi:hypothetical protein
MILDVYVCDRCDEELGPLHPDDDAWGWVMIDAPCEIHGTHRSQFCSWVCAMHACAMEADHQEDHEAHVEADREED